MTSLFDQAPPSAHTLRSAIKSLKIEKRAFIGGKFIATKATIANKFSPVSGEAIAGVSSCGKAEVDLAVASAKSAFLKRKWVDLSQEEKRIILFRLADLIEANKEELSLLDTFETGRAFKNYYYDSIPKAISAIRWFVEASDKYFDDAITPSKNTLATIVHEPIGVVGLITPWNDPLVVAMWKLIPALLMGNSVVMKPAEQSSLSMLKVAELATIAGIPPGVLNVIPGMGNIAGKNLALHADVGAIFFTGSSAVGKQILLYAGQSNMKKVGLECGGKSAFIIQDKCSRLKEAARVLAKNIFYNQGQICSAPSRLIISKKIKKEFLEMLIEESRLYIPNNPLNIKTEVGCLISREQKRKIERYIKNGLASGASIITEYPGKNKNSPELSIPPVIFDQVDPTSVIAQEEIFGPVLCVIDSETAEEAIEIANNTKYGLAASVWTDDLHEAMYISRKLCAGIVHVNSYGDDSNSVPFGGFKESGIGKDKSIYAFAEYSNLKTTWITY